MAYNLTSGDLVQRSLVLGSRSLLASLVAPHATGTSLPQVAPHATGTWPPQVDQHIAPQSDRHIAHCPRPTPMNTAQFSKLLSFINCHSVGITQDAWQSTFGVISEKYPWSADFWNGFKLLMATDYLPHSKMSHLCIDAFVPGWFTRPENFNKSAAEAPKTGLNPASSDKYPCFILAYVYKHPYYEMVCIHQALRHVQHWKVHESWLK